MDRLRALVEINLTWLRQAEELLENIGSSQYAQAPPGFEPHRVGAHLRHVVEFYGCFFEGLERGQIDYDARRRDQSVEHSRQEAAAAIRLITCRFKTSTRLRGDAVVRVRMEDADARLVQDPFVTSSIHRELQVLSSHTIHHFALIAMTLLAHGVPVAADFGVAPSTLRHRAGKPAAEAA